MIGRNGLQNNRGNMQKCQNDQGVYGMFHCFPVRIVLILKKDCKIVFPHHSQGKGKKSSAKWRGN